MAHSTGLFVCPISSITTPESVEPVRSECFGTYHPIYSPVSCPGKELIQVTEIVHLTASQLEAGLDEIRSAPRDGGVLHMIVRRPSEEVREVLQVGELDLTEGLVGDNWGKRPSPRTDDGSPHPDMQLNLMNSRVIALISQSKDRWKLAGDQMFVDLDLGADNLPPGTKLSLGTATIMVTDQPHTGCKKFSARFGVEALKFVNSPVGKQLSLRGINAKVIAGGTIREGDTIKKIQT